MALEARDLAGVVEQMALVEDHLSPLPTEILQQILDQASITPLTPPPSKKELWLHAG
jgi:hypothetical protein